MRGLVFVLALLLAACEPQGPQPQDLPLQPLAIVKQDGSAVALRVQVADTPDETVTGLMWRKDMPEHHGMLFVFDKPSVQSFWMKNTLIPLDILFIGDKGRILHIHANAVPHDVTGIGSRFPVREVLEINGGMAAKWGVRVGDRITLAQPPQSQ